MDKVELSVQQEIEATARVGQAGATLNTLMGRPAREALVLAALPETEPRLPTPAGQTAPPTPEQLEAMGLERPDLRALRAEVSRAEAQVDAARAARRPLVTITGNLLKRIPETLLGGFAWAIGGAIVQSLFDGGRSRAQVEAARAERLRSGATLKEAERQVAEQVEQLRLAVDAAEKRLSAEEARVTAAQEALRVARSQLRAGIVAEVFVTEAETVLARAQTDALNARFEAARSRARLAYAAGTAYPETVTAVAVAPPGSSMSAFVHTRGVGVWVVEWWVLGMRKPLVIAVAQPLRVAYDVAANAGTRGGGPLGGGAGGGLSGAFADGL